jgi:hypothetical protein
VVRLNIDYRDSVDVILVNTARCEKKTLKKVEKKRLGGYNDVVTRTHNPLFVGANSTEAHSKLYFRCFYKG